jgi:hypothetical protein
MGDHMADKPEPKRPDTKDALSLAVDAWVVEYLYNSPVATDTEAFNHLTRALPALKEKLAALV